MKIGFTCGCYDLFHSGHLSFLEECKKRCDLLIVALATDARAKSMNKSIVERPLIPFAGRKVILEALTPVGLVIEDSEGPLPWIKILKPTFYFKGLDWEGKLPIEETEACRLSGTEIIYIDSMDKTSTSKILEKIRG